MTPGNKRALLVLGVLAPCALTLCIFGGLVLRSCEAIEARAQAQKRAQARARGEKVEPLMKIVTVNGQDISLPILKVENEGLSGAVGRWGTAELKVIQVVGSKDALVTSGNSAEICWLHGLNTSQFWDGCTLRADVYMIIGTTRYATAFGSSKQVLILFPISELPEASEQAREVLDAIDRREGRNPALRK